VRVMNEYREPAEREAAHAHVPEVVTSEVVYEGRVVTLRVDEITIARGGTATRVVVDHPGAVVMIALDDQERVFLVEQYRHAIGRMLRELPAGTLEPGEEPLLAAKRELREEVGVVAAEWTYLGSFYSSPGFVNEHLHVFVARKLTELGPQPDFDEDLSVLRVPLSELRDRLVEIPDAKSLAALYLLEVDSDRGNLA
jgi:ADP-ribose diphosphatase